MSNGFAARVAKQNRQLAKNHERSTNAWADKLVKQNEARERAGKTCPACGEGIRKRARYCEHCGEEMSE